MFEPCGPTKDQNFDGLIVTEETLKGADYVNNIRKDNNIDPLKIFVIGLINSGSNEDNFKSKMSSSIIRNNYLSKLENNINILEELKICWDRLMSQCLINNRKFIEICFDKIFRNTQKIGDFIII